MTIRYDKWDDEAERRPATRYLLRTLLLAGMIGPPILAGLWYLGNTPADLLAAGLFIYFAQAISWLGHRPR